MANPELALAVAGCNIISMPKKSARELLDEVALRLDRKFSELPAGRIATAVDDAHTRFEDSVIRDFIPLLVERRVSRELSLLAADPTDDSFELTTSA